MAVTLKELAKALDLDHSTVAYALSGKGTIKEATRQRVKEAAAQMGYLPNALARRMRSKRTHVIGLVIPDVILNYNEFIQQLFRAASAHTYEVQIALTEFTYEQEDRAVRSLLGGRVDGLVIKSLFADWSQVPDQHALRQAVAQRTPVVCYGYPICGSRIPYFQSPATQTGKLAAEHLLSLGHRRFAWLMPLELPLYKLHIDRVNGTVAALAKHRIDQQALQVLTLKPGEVQPVPAGRHEDLYHNYINEWLPRVGVRRGRSLIRRAMELNPRPTAVLCLNEMTAIGAIVEVQELGLRVPQDVAVVATMRTVAAELAPMSLTTVDVPMPEAAGKTLDLLLKLIQGESTPRQVTASPVLVAGRSTVGEGNGVGILGRSP